MKKNKLLFFLLFPFCSGVLGSPVDNFNRSPRALLMGDAYTALADDEYTLYYNPAALGRHSGLSLHFINPDLSLTNALDEVDRFDDFPSDDPAAISDRIIGFPLHIHLGGTPGIKMGSFGMSFLANSTTNVILRNAIHPSLDIDYKLDRGWIIGYAYSFGSGGRNTSKRKKAGGKSGGSGGGGGRKTSLGVAVKNINRQGIFENFDLFGLELLNKISANSSDIDGIRRALGYSYGEAWGVDLGAEHTISSAVSQLNLAVSVQDLADTRFVKKEGSRELPKQKMSINLGASWTQNFTIVDYTLSVDLAPLGQYLPFGRSLHLGMEVGLPIVSALFGWNGGYISYGLGINIWVLKLYAGFYGVELGGHFRQEEGKRGVIYLSILDFSFDT